MGTETGRRADRAWEGGACPHRQGVFGLIVLALCAAGCTATDKTPIANSTPRGPTVAFESIDGPPESIFRKLVQNLSEEAEARQIAVVSREQPAQYRVRGYLAALVQGKHSTTIAWVWDVYDSNQRRALRITGEESASGAGHGTWAAADDQVLRRVAHNGMDRLVAFLASPGTEPEAPPPSDGRRVYTTASTNENFTPESAGIFRIFDMSNGQTKAARSVPVDPERTNDTSPPQQQPGAAGFTSTDALALVSRVP